MKFHWFRRQHREAELDAEIRSHFDQAIRDRMDRGEAPDEAHLNARREFGNVGLVKEVTREMWGWAALDRLGQDLRFGLRMLRKNPSFTFVAMLSLALGIGANTAIFQLIDAVRLRMLPIKAPQALVEVRLADTKGVTGGVANAPNPRVTYRVWEQIREQQQALSGVFAWGMDSVNLAPGGEMRPAQSLWASGDFFTTLGVQPALGRFFTTADDQRGCGEAGVVISHAFWQREFGGDAQVIGRKLTLSERQFDIIGVAPAGFFGIEVGQSFDLAMPLCAMPLVRGNAVFLEGSIWWLTVNGRLPPGSSLEQVTAHTQAISSGVFAAALPANYPVAYVKEFLATKLIAVPAGAGISRLRENYAQSLWLLLAIAGSVLLIACANLANLLLARANARERELAVRQSLGASRGRLVRQLLVESMLLAVAGAVLGAMLAQWLSRFLVVFLSTSANPITLDLTMDWRVLGFAAALAVLTCLLFGLVPALRATRLEPGAVMKAGGRGMTAGQARFSLRRASVVAQVALSLVLVAGALLFSRSLVKLLTVDTGFRQEGILNATIVFQRLNLPRERIPAFKDELLDRLRAIPGVEAAAIAHELPLNGRGGANIRMDGLEQGQSVSLSRVGSDYFKTLNIPLLAGRAFDARDRMDATKVAVVNEAFARRFLNGANPVGQRFHLEAAVDAPETAYEIVGMVRDTKYGNLREEFRPLAYTSPAQDPRSGPGGNVLIRSRLPQAEIVAAVKRTLNEINPAIAVNFQSFQTMIEATILRERLLATLSGFFGVLALLLACIGLYGILSYSVTSRTQEIGVRLALGAQPRDVFWLVLREALWLVAIGVIVGLPVIFAVTRLAATLLYGLTPTDPVSLLLAALLLVTVALLAGFLPSRRATRVDPMIALRCD